MVVHKLPGGSRVIDTLGPDEANITWGGLFFGNAAYSNVLALDGMRAAGQIISLTFGGQFRTVIIDTFSYKLRREPVWIEYSISCTVYINPSLGVTAVTSNSIDSLVESDLGLATTAATPAESLASGIAPV